MRLIGIVYLVSFCCHLDVAPTDVPFELISAFLNKISWIGWNWLNNIKFYPDDVILQMPEIIRRAGYPVEVHVVMTEDGYFLTLHRIPGGNNSLPVLLQHGLMCTSAVWITLGKGKALAYLLADQGYDVWLGNSRGSIYSRTHISLSSTTLTYWNFSLDEVGIYDLPAMITFIANMRSQPLHTYIGHSMGTTSFYIMALKRPEIARMVQKMISFGPTVFMDHMTSPIRHFSLIFITDSIILQYIFHKFLIIESVRVFLKYLCAHNLGKEICAHTISTLWGYDWKQFNYTLLPDIMSHFPGGGSSHMFTHYAQSLRSRKFRQYDHGRAKNLLIYDSVEPPDYDLSKITVSIAVFYGLGDTLIDIVDLKRFVCALPNVMDLYEVPWPNFNHGDFIWANDAPKLVYERVFKIMRKETINNITLALKIKDECTTLTP